jgi:hypothetical protein
LAAFATLGEKYAPAGALGDVLPSSEYDAKIDKKTAAGLVAPGARGCAP